MGKEKREEVEEDAKEERKVKEWERESKREKEKEKEKEEKEKEKDKDNRHVSDEEDGNLTDDDSTTWSVNSIDDMLDAQEPHEVSDTWAQDLHNRIEEIIDRKRSSAEGREHTLMAYNHYLMARYCYDEIEGKISELYPALCKSIKAGTGEKEACLALRDHKHVTVKAAAIRAVAALAVYGGASDSEISDIMNEFLEIIESDGNLVDAPDSVEVVTAACEEWGNLATLVDDLEEESEAAMEAFVEQLESSSTSVRIAAGENIALIYEKSYTQRDSNDPEPTEDEKVDEYGFPLDVSGGFMTHYQTNEVVLQSLPTLIARN
ncbi:hypothetical protein EYC84_001497 [Monilinia fructicola]|uniref:Interferon-related developmental regulator N-terminal domain-containing protein n=1 Tax=Monilinia fructicola TaxID=38448 RepID=A0A5M9JS27_MONFR|nr:hypothetical protein EYC84_001497 [Monilinia fructicola]